MLFQSHWNEPPYLIEQVFPIYFEFVRIFLQCFVQDKYIVAESGDVRAKEVNFVGITLHSAIFKLYFAL